MQHFYVFPLTRETKAADKPEPKKRIKRGPVQLGVMRPLHNRKLTAEQVRQLRHDWGKGNWKLLAERYGYSGKGAYRSLKNIVDGTNYAWVK